MSVNKIKINSSIKKFLNVLICLKPSHTFEFWHLKVISSNLKEKKVDVALNDSTNPSFPLLQI
jgi:hypothetical protein